MKTTKQQSSIIKHGEKNKKERETQKATNKGEKGQENTKISRPPSLASHQCHPKPAASVWWPPWHPRPFAASPPSLSPSHRSPTCPNLPCPRPPSPASSTEALP